MIRTLSLTITLGLALSACGGRIELKPKGGSAMPIAPEGAQKVPTPDDLMTPTSQAKPKRSDEQLKRSEERQDDAFDLPPTG